MASDAKLLDGKKLAHGLEHDLNGATERLIAHYGVTPQLAIIRVGDDPASELYVSSKGQQAASLGFQFQERHFAATASASELHKCINELNDDDSVHGVILQLPLPYGFDKHTLLKAIDPVKDVDGLHPLNVGKLWQGDSSGLVACTPQGCKLLLDTVHPSLVGKNVLVIGCSILVGRPMAAILLNEDATVTLAHSLTKGLPELCQQADVMIVAIGDPLFIQSDWIKPGATLIDVGINRLEDGKVVGDIDFDNARKVAGYISPVPGGVGPMTVACLMRNTYVAAERTVIVD